MKATLAPLRAFLKIIMWSKVLRNHVVLAGKRQGTFWLAKPFMSINKLAIGTAQFGLNYGINNRTGQSADYRNTAHLKRSKTNGCKHWRYRHCLRRVNDHWEQ